MSGQVTITQLPVAGALTGNESVPIVQNGVTVQTTTGAIAVQPTQTQTFLTVGQQTSLANSRQIAVSTGLTFTDGGAQGSYTIAVTGALASLISSGTGIQVKTGSMTLTPRQIAVNTGLSITNPDGVSGNPTISLSTLLQNFNSVSGTGLLALNGTAVSVTSVTGVGGQVSVTNGTTAPQIGLATTSVTSGTYTAPTITVDAYGRITSAISVSYLTQITAGTGLTGGVITGSGTIALATVGTAGTYGDYSRVPVFTTNAYGQITTVTNTSISISANQVTSDILPIARGGTNNNATPTSGTVVYGNGTALSYTAVGSSGQVLTSQGSGAPIWTSVGGTGTVTTVSVVTANGFAGSVATATTTPAITLSTTVTGIIKGNGTAISAATAGTDYLAPPSGTAILKANSGGALANAVSGTDYAPATSGTSILYGNNLGGFSNVTIGSGVSFSGGTLSATGSGGTVTSVSFTGGLINVATSTTTPALTVSGTSGGIVYFSGASTWASSSLLSANALMVGGGAGSAPSTITTGTGVVTALGVNTGSVGAFVVNGGALGTPSSGTLTNATGLPISTGVSGLGTGVASALAVNTGSAGAVVLFNGALGTPSSGTVTNLTGTASININGTVGATTPTTGAFTTVSASGQITSTVATGTAPFVVSSTTQVANLNSATAGTATNATNVALTAGSGATNYLHFSSSATGNQPVNTNASLTYNYTNNTLTAGINGGTF
jgi:hypothetical protein